MGSKLEAAQIAVNGGVRVTVMSSQDLRMIPAFVEKSKKNYSKLTVPSFGTIFIEANVVMKDAPVDTIL